MSQATLFGKTVGEIGDEEERKLAREELEGCLKVIDSILSDPLCMVEAQLDVERYNGIRGLPFLDLNNEEYWVEEGAPPVENYVVGSYWTGVSDGTCQFIRARLEWAKEWIRRRIGEMEDTEAAGRFNLF